MPAPKEKDPLDEAETVDPQQVNVERYALTPEQAKRIRTIREALEQELYTVETERDKATREEVPRKLTSSRNPQKCYTNLRYLGKGGYATCYEARDENLGRQVVIKIITLTNRLADYKVYDSDFHNEEVLKKEKERRENYFFEEMAVTANLSHPHIVFVYDAGKFHTPEGEDKYFFVMEKCEKSLSDLLDVSSDSEDPDDSGDPEPCYGWNSSLRKNILGLSRAILYMHQQGRVHGDLKPANVLLTEDETSNGFPLWKIIDFGLSQAINGDPGKMYGNPGTTSYMPPECFLFPSSDREKRKSEDYDWYAFAEIIFEVLTEKRVCDILQECISRGVTLNFDGFRFMASEYYGKRSIRKKVLSRMKFLLDSYGIPKEFSFVLLLMLEPNPKHRLKGKQAADALERVIGKL